METEEPAKKKQKTEDSEIIATKSENDVPVIVIHDEEKNSDIVNQAKLEKENDSKDSEQIPHSNNEAEQKVGMELCINKTHFQGIIKQRYSDFMVRECQLDGTPVYLTNTDHLDKVAKEEEGKEEKKDEELVCPITDEDVLKKIDEFANSEDKKSKMILEADDDKEHRKLVHMFIKTKYKQIETGTTMLQNQSRAVILSFKSNKDGKVTRRERPKRNIPKFCHFVCFKQNKDTMECINLIARMLRIHPGNFGYAGTKDRRATTMQKVSVQNTLSERLYHLNKGLRNIVLGNFSYATEGLSLGDLSGNEFTLVIRDVSNCTEESAKNACISLQDNGFINYFGLQRFGTGSIPTNDIGKALLSSNFEEACNMILQLPDANNTNVHKERESLQIWAKTKDAGKALNAIQFRHSIEGKLLEGLRKCGNKNFLDAMKNIPRNTRLLYLHSYQSLIWNKAVSHRIKEYGITPIVGDLVLKPDKDENDHQQVHTLTTDDISSNQYCIEDIVLPLPGYDMTYPSNSCFDYMKKIMADDGFDITNMRRQQKELSLSGKYRNILIKPKKMSWEFIRYNDYTISLMKTDVEEMREKKKNTEQKPGEDHPCFGVADGNHLALKLQLTLPSSCYATTALRELLLSDSSYKAQAELNENFSAKNNEGK